MNLWNFYANFYKVLRSNPISKTILNVEHQSLLKLLELRIVPSGTNRQALDLGTGRGECLKCIPTDIGETYAIDKSPKMVDLTSNKHKYVDVSVGDVCHTPYDNNSMDLILCVGVSEYVADLDELMTEIKRLLHETGYVIFTSSPPNLLNQLRKMFGHSLYLRSQSEISEIVLRNNFKLLSSKRTMIQDQYLIVHDFPTTSWT